jgi:hypothetical protein
MGVPLDREDGEIAGLDDVPEWQGMGAPLDREDGEIAGLDGVPEW